MDPLHFRRVLGQFPTGVVIVAATSREGRPVGLSIGSFTSVSLDPPLVAFLPARTSTTWPAIQEAGRFCINVLGAGQEQVCRAFAKSRGDKFADVEWDPTASGCPRIRGSLAWMDCELEQVHEAGDHFIVLGRVNELDVDDLDAPLLFFQGGFGRLAAGPLVAGARDHDLDRPLRHVDRCRGLMDELATSLEVRCVASAVVGDDVVFLASAGALEDRGTSTLIGQRFPAIAPAAIATMAWEPEARVERWLAGSDDPADLRARLDAVRERGYAVSLEGLGLDDWSVLLAPRTETPATALEDHVRRRGRASIAPPGELREHARKVRTLHFPIFGADGRSVLTLNVGGFAACDETAIVELLTVAQEASRRMTALVSSPD